MLAVCFPVCMMLSTNSDTAIFFPKKKNCTVSVSVLNRGILNQLVNLFCVFPIPDGDAKRHKAYTSLDNRCPTSSLRDPGPVACSYGGMVIGVVCP